MVYVFALTSPTHNSYLQKDNGKFVSVKIIEQNFKKTFSRVCAYFSFMLLLAATPSATSSEYQKHVLSNGC